MKFFTFILVISFFIRTVEVHSQTKSNTLENILSAYPSYKEKMYLLDSLYDYYFGKNWDSSLIVLQKALELAEANKDTQNLVKAYSKLGIAQYEAGKYKDALKSDIKSYELYTSLGNQRGIAHALNEIGTIYDILGESDKAKENLQKSLEIRLKLGNKEDIFDSYNNIGVFYYYQGNYKKALEYYKKAQATLETPSILNNIGEIYLEIGQYDQALSYFQKALSHFKTNSSYIQALILRNIGLVYYGKKEYDKAIFYIKQSTEIARKVNSRLLIKENYAYLTEIYKAKKDYKNALIYKTKFSDLKDSLFQENQLKAIADMNAKYQVSVKEKENEILKKNLKIRDQEIRMQRILTASVAIILLLFAFVAYIFYRGKKKLRLANDLLKEKNEEINQQNEEIRAQAEKLSMANEEISSKNKQLEKKNKNITESIFYAERIQSAVLDYRQYESKKNLFILNQPKDIVSGDFFFMEQIQNANEEKLTIITVADCTGHGVPGALMSMLGTSFINEIIKETTEPNEILEKLRLKIKKAMHQEGIEDERGDGMDIAICTINHSQKLIFYAGANNPLYLVKRYIDHSELITLKADRQPVGFYVKERPFKKQIIEYKKGDIIYLFSDGYRDQFGKDKKKIGTKDFKQLLLDISGKPLDKQKELLKDYFNNWKGDKKQTDDVLVIGLILD